MKKIKLTIQEVENRNTPTFLSGVPLAASCCSSCSCEDAVGKDLDKALKDFYDTVGDLIE